MQKAGHRSHLANPSEAKSGWAAATRPMCSAPRVSPSYCTAAPCLRVEFLSASYGTAESYFAPAWRCAICAPHSKCRVHAAIDRYGLRATWYQRSLRFQGSRLHGPDTRQAALRYDGHSQHLPSSRAISSKHRLKRLRTESLSRSSPRPMCNCCATCPVSKILALLAWLEIGELDRFRAPRTWPATPSWYRASSPT
jgi:hypothetical protein